MKRLFVALFLLTAIFLENVAEAKSLKKGEVYRSLDGTETIEIISNRELEILETFVDMGIIVSRDTIVAEYDFKGDKLRVVYTVEGTKKVRYFLLIEKGLKDEKSGKVLYSKAGLAALEEQRKKAEEEKRKEIRLLFTDNGDGVVIDNKTRLMWTKDGNLLNKLGEWKEVLDYLDGMNAGRYPNYGYSDWRLPTKEELEGLLSKIHKYPIHLIPFNNVQRIGSLPMFIYYCDWCYLSSTPHPTFKSTVWGVSISSKEGVTSHNTGTINIEGYLWPVRSKLTKEGKEVESKAVEERKKVTGTAITSIDPIIGQMLFMGERGFLNGGPPCISCHSAGKGIPSIRISAPNLGDVYDSLKNSHLNEKWVNNTTIHTKKPIYSGKNITKEEMDYLNTFFRLTGKLEEDYSRGVELFTGAKRFTNGGLPCVTCHSISTTADFYIDKRNGIM